MTEHYTINHFSVSLPAGGGQNDVPHLLEHVANTIEAMDEKIIIQDLVFSIDVDSDGNDWPSFTVYYYTA